MIKLTAEKAKRLGKSFSPRQMTNGVMNSLSKRGFGDRQSVEVVYAYIAHIGGNPNMSLEDCCVEIQKDFDTFIRFTREIQPRENDNISSPSELEEFDVF